MTYKFFVSDNGSPATGLTPSWSSLYALDGTDKSGSAPAISEVGGGWYTFELTYGTAPFDVAELVGVIDAGSSLADHDRYRPVHVTVRDLALARMLAKRTYNLATGVEEIRNDADDGYEARLTLSESSNVETLAVSGGGDDS